MNFEKTSHQFIRGSKYLDSGEHFPTSLESDHEILDVVPWQTPDAEERAAIAEAGPADVDSEQAGSKT